MIGIDLGSQYIKVSTVKDNKILTDIFEVKAESSYNKEVVKKIGNFLKKNKIKDKLAAISIPDSFAKILKLQIPKIPEKEIEQSVIFQAITSLSISDTEFQKKYDYDYQIISKKGDMSDILFVAALKEEINKRMKIIWECGLIPSVVTVNSLALINCFLETETLAKTQTIILLNIGAKYSNIIILKEGEIVFLKELQCGSLNITEKILNDMKISFKEAELIKKDAEKWPQELDRKKILEESLGELFETLYRSVNYCFDHKIISNIDRILLTGGGANFVSIDLLLTEMFNVLVERWQPFKKGISFSISFGLSQYKI